MADIELVIKIPKRVYNYIRKYEHIANSDVLDVKDAIINGTPLPKGHGKIVDINEVEEYLNNIQLELDGWGDTDSAIEIAKARMELDFITPIIEADKEQEDDNT